ncbi:hypothetical protein D3C77_818910 [compost metagenome]
MTVHTGHKLDLVAQGLANDPGAAEAIGAVAVVDAHRFAFRHRWSSPARFPAGFLDG